MKNSKKWLAGLLAAVILVSVSGSSVVTARATETGSEVLGGETGEAAGDANIGVNSPSIDNSGEAGTPAGIVVQGSGVISAKVGIPYALGFGKWKVAGDSTNYLGGITFYVPADGEYEFILQ